MLTVLRIITLSIVAYVLWNIAVSADDQPKPEPVATPTVEPVREPPKQPRTGDKPYFGCYTEENLDLIIDFSNKRDEQGARYLFSNDKCVFVPTESDVSILDTTFTGKVHLIVHMSDGQKLDVWTMREALAL
jgi:hypothetical protein